MPARDALPHPAAREAPTVPPLSLYIHTPWCLRKCPYCDFNSHAVVAGPPYDAYVDALLNDLDGELGRPGADRPLTSLFIGGGTPSLFPGPAIETLLSGIRARMTLSPDCEITLEANPGATDNQRLADYRVAGVNRLSIGVQSLNARHLQALGRIHDPSDARAAVAAARGAGFDNLNLDLMFALPGQDLAEALADLDALIDLAPEHISFYQLTLEPNTAFHARPPALPDEDLAADIGTAGRERLAAAGYEQYEVSAYARAGRRCRHNLNYWHFGDYLGLGAGAHGKLTDPHAWVIARRAKPRHPDAYLAAYRAAAHGTIAKEPRFSERTLTETDKIFEFALNAFRLTAGFPHALFGNATGLPWPRIGAAMDRAEADGLVRLDPERVVPTALGRAFVDDLVGRFLP